MCQSVYIYIYWYIHVFNVCVCVYMCAVPARLVVCDMVVGSVERIINSSWLLRSLDWLRVLALVVQRRQLSYKVTTQVCPHILQMATTFIYNIEVTIIHHS